MPAALNQIPNKPGVYLLKDNKGKIIYVGKAKLLRNRIRSYFAAASSPRTQALTSKIKDVDYIVTGSEIEALILEANLIKLHLPHYNIRLKDDKKYPYIKVTFNENFPQVFPTRDLRDRSAIYFGPYTNVKTMKRALKSATKIFPIRTCRSRMPNKICLDYHIGRCSGPCEGKISQERYKKIVQELVDFLAGKSKKVEHKLQSEMKTLSSDLEFEEAAKARDRLQSVQSIVRKQRIVFPKPVDLDIFGLQRKRNHACIALIPVREGRIIGSEHYTLHIQPRASDAEIMRAFLLQYYKNAFVIPKEMILRSIEEKKVIENWLKTKITLPKRGKKLDLVNFAEKNAALWLGVGKVERIPQHLKQLQRVLHIDKLPRRIEAFDVSNIGGKYAVGSCVSFVNGRINKSGYLRFKIKTVTGIDDVAMMKEITGRRAKRGNLPDLILVDGGIGQVRAARKKIPEEIPVYGLAKRFEELYTPKNKIISFPKDSPALRLLQRIRNEAHRFAISYHKLLRDKPKSLLTEIPGIGEQKKKALLKHFNTFEKIRRASIRELEEVPGIGGKHAKQIYNFLHLF